MLYTDTTDLPVSENETVLLSVGDGITVYNFARGEL